MSEQRYDIYYLDGLTPDVSATEAEQRLMKLTRVSQQQAQLLIASTNRVIKSGLSKDHAVKYMTALQRVGMRVEIRDPLKKEEPAQSPAPTVDLDDDIVEAVKRKQLAESSHNYDRTLK